MTVTFRPLIKRTWRSIAAGLAGWLMLSSAASGDFDGLLVHPVAGTPADLQVWRVWAGFTDPDDRLLGITQADIHPTCGGTLFRNPLGQTTAPNSTLAAVPGSPFDTLLFDTFVTIGLESYPYGGTDSTVLEAGSTMVPSGFTGGWINSNLGNDQGAPGAHGGPVDGDSDLLYVLIAQFTLQDPIPGAGIVGDIVVEWQDGGGTDLTNAVFSTQSSGTDDTDGDCVPDDQDNCPSIANANQLDTDGDEIGDACDLFAGCAPGPTCLVSWWLAESDATDLVGANDGAQVNGTTFADGRVGQAFSFDGLNDHVALGNVLSLPAGDFTIEGWINADTLPTAESVRLFGRTTTGGNNIDWQYFGTLHIDGRVYGSVDSGINVYSVKSAAIMPATWYHYAFLREAGALQLYLDGNLQETNAAAAGLTLNDSPAMTFSIGRAGSYDGQYFDGRIDELTIYCRALTAAEVQSIYYAGALGKCTASPDSDGDGLTDVEELTLGTDLFDADSDDDGLTDGAEVILAAGGSCPSPLNADSDGDEVHDSLEVGGGTALCDDDSDGDGLSDGAEISMFGTDPLVADSDGDEISDGREILLAGGGGCPSPADPDSDDDGLNDGDEDTAGTSKCGADTDNDGLSDSEEAGFGTNPLVADTDGDGWSDSPEVNFAIGSSCPSATNPDSDGDGLSDGQEFFVKNTHPCDTDTDGDGVTDDVDPQPTQPGVDGDFLASWCRLIANQILGTSFPSSDFIVENPVNIRHWFAICLDGVAKKIDSGAGSYKPALATLRAVRQRVDGLPSPPDLMVSGPSQAAVDGELSLIIALLELLQ